MIKYFFLVVSIIFIAGCGSKKEEPATQLQEVTPPAVQQPAPEPVVEEPPAFPSMQPAQQPASSANNQPQPNQQNQPSVNSNRSMPLSAPIETEPPVRRR